MLGRSPHRREPVLHAFEHSPTAGVVAQVHNNELPKQMTTKARIVNEEEGNVVRRLAIVRCCHHVILVCGI
jgi:hypothetical protein